MNFSGSKSPTFYCEFHDQVSLTGPGSGQICGEKRRKEGGLRQDIAVGWRVLEGDEDGRRSPGNHSVCEAHREPQPRGELGESKETPGLRQWGLTGSRPRGPRCRLGPELFLISVITVSFPVVSSPGETGGPSGYSSTGSSTGKGEQCLHWRQVRGTNAPPLRQQCAPSMPATPATHPLYASNASNAPLYASNRPASVLLPRAQARGARRHSGGRD